ncbi:MAG: S41 family peptidase [Microlunatus sp.]|nr:S41 family peptidase [Microlunatus sp.]
MTSSNRAAAATPDQPVTRANLEDALAVPDFLAGAGSLTLAERQLIVDQALVLLEGNYVHLPLKMAMHAVNPVQRLRLLRTRLQRQAPATMEAEWLFHREMASIFMSVRDLHTNYLLPKPFAGRVAYLPFVLEKATDGGADHYLVTSVVTGFSAPDFGLGTEVTHWNGVPIARAVEINGLRLAGSNRAANLARGLDSLTIRPLVMQLPPDEDWIDVSYLDAAGSAVETRVAWEVGANLPPMADLDSISTPAIAAAVDLDADERTRARKLLYHPEVVELDTAVDANGTLEVPRSVAAADVATTMPSVFRARTVTTSHGAFGQIRIFTFSVQDPVAFRDEFVRLIGLLPQNGLIVDVRGNGGGHLYASEFTLQTLTPKPIVPEPVQFIATPLNLALCRRHKDNTEGIDLGPWFASLDQAIEIGAAFSAAYPITPTNGANEIGQAYHGPAVLVTDARCYSATDFFAAGWADHEIGPILGVDDATGAGGANVWTHGLLIQLLGDRASEPDSPYAQLPKGTNMRVAIRRGLRVGALSGTPVEDLGVTPTVRHQMTRADVLNGNVDLFDRAGEILAGQPVRRLVVDTAPAGSDLTVTLITEGLDRVDVYADGRPVASPDITGSPTVVTIAGASAGATVLAEGFSAGDLVASRRVVA